MKNKFFWLSPDEYILGPYKPEVRPQVKIDQPEPEVKPKASWFPSLLQAIPVGQFNLFRLVAGSENELLPNQRKLKEWINHQAQKHEPLKFPIFDDEVFADEVFAALDEQSAKEELSRKIITHLETGSSEMFFLPALPVNPHIKQDHKKKSSPLFKLQMVPRIFPTALA